MDSLSSLPKVVMKHDVAGYLTCDDICRLSVASKKLHSQFSLSITPPRKIISEFTRIDYRNGNANHGPYRIEYGFEIPVPARARVACHSMRVTMNWRDQGRGNRKGHLVIMEGDEGEDFGGRTGAVVFASGMAPHFAQKLSITFAPKRNRSYHLWYAAGGGGGCSLHLFDVTIQALVFDDASRSFSKAHDFVAGTDAFVPWDAATSLTMTSPRQAFCHDSLELKRILANASRSLENGWPVAPPIVSFFSRSGVDGLDLSPRLVRSILSILDGLVRELYLYDKCCICDFEDVTDPHQSACRANLQDATCDLEKESDSVDQMDNDCQEWEFSEDEDFDPFSMKW